MLHISARCNASWQRCPRTIIVNIMDATCVPLRIQKILSVVEGVSSDKLAELADKAIEHTLPTMASPHDASGVDSLSLVAIERLTEQIRQLTTLQDG